MGFSFLGHHRIDWFWGDPNKSGALIALVVIVLLGQAWSQQRWNWWRLGATALAVLGIAALAGTYSRGALLGLIVGFIILCIRIPAATAGVRIGRSIAFAMVLVVCLFLSDFHRRIAPDYVGGDRSVLNRWEQWWAAPRMMVDAPAGWEDPGRDYTRWYKPASVHQTHTVMVASHLQVMVGSGWSLRCLYLALWLLALGICWPSATRSHATIPFALIVSSAAMWCANHLASRYLFVAIPLLAWMAVLVLDFRTPGGFGRHYRLACTWSLGATCLLSAALWMAGRFPLDRFERDPQGVMPAGTTPGLWVIGSGERLLGRFWGEELRAWMQDDLRGSRLGPPAWVPDATLLPAWAHAPVLFLGASPELTDLADGGRKPPMPNSAQHALVAAPWLCLLDPPQNPTELFRIVPTTTRILTLVPADSASQAVAQRLCQRYGDRVSIVELPTTPPSTAALTLAELRRILEARANTLLSK